ncbi:uncharacterized protein LOC118284468 isoform X2 [Scophthalmus maximus]|uniref:uncharacterized protein LOC118284468 isoform X2 n=1 Tax=Scophthalmus maximus TaxID=52904 RepID=UPI0015E14E48|nr:uncharacterized protein LOC118284468 isoform X2 [Scophthalmus maximus]XP_035463077.1 uncharacterized protein LOC118284468 isoform X2 [Scophthalmus maximus]
MPIGHQFTGSTPLQIPPQPSLHPILLDTVLVQAIINPKRGMEGSLQPQTPSPKTCGSPGAAGASCRSLDVRVAVLLLSLAGALILLLLYRLLQLRHRLRVARARHALEYHGFYRTATYTLKHPAAPCHHLPPPKNGTVPEATLPPVQTVNTVTHVAVTPLPPPVSGPPPLPLPPPPSLPPTPPPVLTLPLPLPVIHTVPPSPHLSWGACSDVDVYSRIGAFRTSRLSVLSNQSKRLSHISGSRRKRRVTGHFFPYVYARLRFLKTFF